MLVVCGPGSRQKMRGKNNPHGSLQGIKGYLRLKPAEKYRSLSPPKRVENNARWEDLAPGRKHSAETRQSEAAKGDKNHRFGKCNSTEHRQY